MSTSPRRSSRFRRHLLNLSGAWSTTPCPVVNELIRALKDARDLVEALMKSAGDPPQWLVDEAAKELVTIDELVARLEH